VYIHTHSQLRAAREYYGILDEHRSKEAGELEVSRAVSKLKGDMLLVEMAMKTVKIMLCVCMYSYVGVGVGVTCCV
jgi:hypothetical protein